MNMASVVVTNQNFNEIINKEGKVLLDFWAPWCGPCRMLGPVLEEISSEEDIIVGKVNADEEEELCSAFNISSIPALFLFKDGKLIKKTVGYLPKDAVKVFINEK